MVFGKATHCDIIYLLHIWPRHTYGGGLFTYDLQPDDVNSPRNFLRLHKDIERAFLNMLTNSFIHSFVDEAVPGPIRLRVVLLDPEILQRKSINVNEKNIHFGDIHEKLLHFQFLDSKRPFLRLLSSHADKALLKAR